MKTANLLLLCALFINVAGNENAVLSWNPVVRQAGLFFFSDRVTTGGAGVGAGIDIRFRQMLTIQPQVHLLWGNGNAVATMVAAGCHKKGVWQPGILAVSGLLWGQRIEVLAADGRRPASPVWTVGIRAAPFVFKYSSGIASLFEFGGGIGPDNGRYFEICILSAGWCW